MPGPAAEQARTPSGGTQPETVIFFDIGGTLASARISPSGTLLGLDADPAVFPVLNRLRSRHFRMGIISNTPTPETAESMRKALTECELYEFFDPNLLVYSSAVPPTDPDSGEEIKAKPDPSIFRYAAGLAGQEAECIFVGEDSRERAGAMSAKMRVSPSPLLVEDVLEGVPLRYLRIGAPRGVEESSWSGDLAGLPLVTLGLLAGRVLAIASAKTAASLDDAGYDVIRLGAPDAPARTDVYLLRDDARADVSAAGFSAAKEGSSSQFFGSTLHADAERESDGDAFTAGNAGTEDEPWNWVLSSDYSGLLVAIPAGHTIENFHFTGGRHGHTLKLIPSPHRLKSFAAGVGFGPAPAFRDLRADEIDLLGKLDGGHIRQNLDRFVGLADAGDGHGPIRSRHIKHPDNNRAVRVLAAEFEALNLTTRLHRFTHEGRSLDNVEAELRGTSDEVVMITAHLDSTAAEGDGVFRPSHDAAPGADDDGSGISATLSLARILAERSAGGQFQRTVRFVLFNAEEQGLVGSQYYASEAADRGDKIVAVFQMDMIGYTGGNQTPPRPFEIHIGHQSDAMTTASRPLTQLIHRFQPIVATELLPPQVYDNTHPPGGDPAAGRSDHASFHDHGYPACVLSEDFFVGPDTTSPAPQENPNYHKPGDTSVEYEYAAQIARCIGAAVLVIADPANSFASHPSPGAHSMSSYLNVDKAREGRKSSSFAKGRTIDRFTNFLMSDPALKGEAPPVVTGTNLLTGTSRRIVLSRPAGFGIPEDETPAGRISQALALVRHIDTAQSKDSFAGIRKFASYLGDDAVEADRPGASEFFADPTVQQIASGDQFVYLNQHHRGIPVFTMARTVRFAKKGSTVELTGDHAPYIDPSLEIRPVVPAADAVMAAVKYIAEHQAEDDTPDEYGESHPASKIDVTEFTPVVHARFNSPSQPTIYEAQGLGATVPASLVVYLSGVEEPRLAWDILITLPQGERQYRVLVPADKPDGEFLYVRKVSTTMSRTSGRGPASKAFATDAAVAAKTSGTATVSASTSPNSAVASPAAMAGITVSGRVFFPSPASGPLQEESFPLDVSRYPLGITTAPPALNPSWVDAGQSYAVGPNAIAVRGFGSPSLPAKRLKGDDSVAGKLKFNSNIPADQQLANIFFFCNYMHDFFFLLGFDVAAGNFEGDDGVIARAHDGPVSGTANMLTHPDHQRPVMNMGLVTGVNRHTAFDADVVFHEYVHGVSNRLVGGPMNSLALEAEQSGSMGEGWSDYFALSIQNYSVAPAQERTTTGDWVVGQPGVGIRNAPYDDKYPFDFGDIATESDLQEVHNAGEIWCACLMHLTRKMIAALGDRERAYRECWQIVVDSFKICPANPSFIDARDAILTALQGRHTAGELTATEFQACRRAAWTAFAGFGMGAQAPNNGSDFANASSDNHMPADLGGAIVNRAKNPRPGGFSAPQASGGTNQPKTDLQQLIELFARLSDLDKAKLLGALQGV